MPPVPTADSGTYRAYTKSAGDEPLPGYKLISPLGRGGFGEVWKCEAPGGLHKAIKFVTSESEDGRGRERFGQELAAFEQIKAIRHPFLLTLERVEQVGNELVMVMELADRQLQDRYRECRLCGLPGIPRDELLAYFADAAEALDMIGAKFNLQHLDIKPANLFLVSGHVKVGDYGLVTRVEGSDASNRGLTPRYVSPEVLHGTPTNRSDQYSLALVYHELLTGEFPYPGRTPQQLMLQHVSGIPVLSALPPADQPAVGKALAKRPDERFPSCLAFVQALMASGQDTAMPAAAMNIRRARVDRSLAEMNVPVGVEDGNPSSISERSNPTHPASGKNRGPEPTQNFTLPSVPHLTVPGRAKNALPALVPASSKLQGPQSRPPIVTTPPPSDVETPPPLAEEIESGLVVLDRIRSVLPVSALLGMGSDERLLNTQEFAAAVVHAAANGGQPPHLTSDIGRLSDGTWMCQFPTTVPTSVVPLKLVVLRESWGVSIEQPDPVHLVLRCVVGGGGFFGGKKFGYEATVILPTSGKPVGEITVLGRTFGTPDAKCVREAPDLLPKLLTDIRAQLANVPERRRHPRLSCNLAVSLYPVHSDGAIDPALTAKCRDVSLGGLAFSIPTPIPTKYIYAAFPDVPTVASQAILIRLIRVQSVGQERHYGAQYRTDL